MSITLTPVESSQIYAIGHNGESILAIQFKDKEGNPGSVYHYSSFSPEHFIAFQSSDM